MIKVLHEALSNTSGMWLDGLAVSVPDLGKTYPKYYKMDKISQAAVCCAEVLLEGWPGRFDPNPTMAVCLYTSAGCMETDKAFLETMAEDAYFPSPSLFTYTLPNLAAGEICIRNKFTGEIMTFVTEAWNPAECEKDMEVLFSKGDTSTAIIGWINYENNVPLAHLYLIENRE